MNDKKVIEFVLYEREDPNANLEVGKDGKKITDYEEK